MRKLTMREKERAFWYCGGGIGKVISGLGGGGGKAVETKMNKSSSSSSNFANVGQFADWLIP